MVPQNGAYPLCIIGEVPESIMSDKRLDLSFNSTVTDAYSLQYCPQTIVIWLLYGRLRRHGSHMTFAEFSHVDTNVVDMN